jgi:hypothetical protein
LRRLIPLALAILAVAGAGSAAGAGTAIAATAHGTAPGAGRPHAGLPAHLFAPYFEGWDTSNGSLAQQSRASGAKYINLAFLQTEQPGSCTAYWEGSTATPISATAAGSFGADIAAIQRAGGNVIPSFGGFTADTTNTELADSCTDVHAIAQVFESLVTTYHVPRIDLDIEADSVNNTAGIVRRNQAIAETEQWAARHGEHVSFSYTLPTFPTGLPPAELAVLQDAVTEHAKIAVVNILTFDYFIGTTEDMLADAESAATGAHAQLAALYPGLSSREVWGRIGVTQMPGIDDFGPPETFPVTDAAPFLGWAASHGLGEISMWAVQRDNGNCPGTKGAGSCSGVDQPAWYFSHVFEPFSRGVLPAPFSLKVAA